MSTVVQRIAKVKGEKFTSPSLIGCTMVEWNRGRSSGATEPLRKGTTDMVHVRRQIRYTTDVRIPGISSADADAVPGW